jgi:hypothetical protein
LLSQKEVYLYSELEMKSEWPYKLIRLCTIAQ